MKVSSGGGESVLEAEQALVAIGFTPNGRNLGLEALGVKVSERGIVEVDERLATSVPGIWAIGDVTGKLMLAHVGSAQGIVCAENIAGVETVTLNYEMMPRATYCSPQIASFGLTEAQAKERGYDVKVGRFPFIANGKALGLGEFDRLGEADHRCEVRRDARGALIRPRGDRATARIDPGADDGIDAGGDRPQRARPPHAERDADGSRPRGGGEGNSHLANS